MPRIDLGAFNQVNQAASMLTGMWPLIGKDALSGFVRDMPSWSVLGDLQESIRSLFGAFQLGQFGECAEGCGEIEADLQPETVITRSPTFDLCGQPSWENPTRKR
ncbi:hypothetical protein [Rhodococcus sp. IEGM 1318]|uniref:hypothetical protein n=1 Tax=Rhodococcus sp. IEGM 1318 TaxID=3082226 RepID=UPI002953254A|nr:hypothetical protein [Rhodococcus sp. IEGM 1318]MDV8009251.1 hypothetical protein [Rhodococcus sp. IEGM 1318]